MSLLERMGLSVLHRMDPEAAHGLALKALKTGLVPLPGPVTSPRLATSVAGLALPNPVGLAAGFDKQAEAVTPLMRAGFGFLEIGGVTPLPQEGNPRPRLFRLDEDRGVINRFGFNSEGMDAVAPRLEALTRHIPVGLNLGANKDSANRAGDYAIVLERTAAAIDFAVINVSSPNTASLRDLQAKTHLREVLEGVTEVRRAQPRKLPVFLKIAPELDDASLADISELALETGIDGIVSSNTTTERAGLHGPHAGEGGGLSGKPLFAPSTRALARLARISEGRIPLIGVGGIASAEDAYAKIRAGASAVQLYSALVFGGLPLVAEIARGLDALLERDGFANVADAVGSDPAPWL